MLQESDKVRADRFAESRMKLPKGFTLIELLVVIAIIAMLLAIIVPALRAVKERVKLIMCGNNQRQVVYGLSTYGVDNIKLPPSTSNQGRPGRYHRPTELNWYMNDVGYPTTPDYDFVGKFLSGYLAEVEVFNCALSPISGESVWPPKTSGLPSEGFYSDFYLNGYYTPLHSTYMLLWNYQGYNHRESVAVDMTLGHFEGPRELASASKLAIQDSFFYLTSNTNLLWPSPQNSWYLSHPFKGSSKAMPYCTLADANKSVFPDAWLNAGYLDGHVERFRSTEAVHVKNFSAEAWLTRKNK